MITKSTTWMVAILGVVLAFALGTMIPEEAGPARVYGNLDDHWDHSGANLFLAPGIEQVGVGTSNPLVDMHVFSSSGGQATQLTVESGPQGNKAFFNLLSETSGAQFRFQADGNAPQDQWSLGARSGSTNFEIVGAQDLVDEPSLMVIRQDGNVGIGTTSPGEKLQVQGNIKLAGNILSDGEICIGSGC